MAQDLGTGYILIQPSTKGLGKAIEDPLNTAVQSASKSGGRTILSKVGGAFKSVGKVGLAAIGTIGGGLAALAAKGGFDRALNIERAQTKLKALGHDTQSVDAIMDDALKSVQGTAFGLGDAASVAATLVASGIQSGTQLQQVLGTVGDAAQIAGVGFKDMGVIFSQVAAKGKLQGDEMLQLMQAGIPVLQYLADHYGITTAAAQEMVSAGKVSFADFEAAMREHIGGAAQSAGESFDGMVGNVKAALSRLGEGFATPLINEATKLGGHVIPLIDQVAGSVDGLADTFAGRLSEAADSLAGILDGLNHDLEDGSLTMGDLAEQAGLLAGGMTVLAGVGGNVDGILSMFDQIGKAGDDGIRNLAAGLKKRKRRHRKVLRRHQDQDRLRQRIPDPKPARSHGHRRGPLRQRHQPHQTRRRPAGIRHRRHLQNHPHENHSRHGQSRIQMGKQRPVHRPHRSRRRHQNQSRATR